jgi:hypothetical protein
VDSMAWGAQMITNITPAYVSAITSRPPVAMPKGVIY